MKQKKKVDLESEAFWTLGLEGPHGPQFLHWKAEGFKGCYIPNTDPAECEQFSTKRELMTAMRRDKDIKYFMEEYPDAVPVKVVRKTEVYLHGHVAS